MIWLKIKSTRDVQGGATMFPVRALAKNFKREKKNAILNAALQINKLRY